MKSIEKNEHFLLLISNSLKFFGLLLLSGILVIFILLFLLDLSTDKQTDWFFKVAKYLPKIIPGVFLLLGTDQFIKYFIKKDLKPNWFIRHVDIFIYVYVICLFISFCYIYIHSLNSPDYQSTLHNFHSRVIFLSFPAISVFVRMLFWTALALVLRKIIPIIEEIKSLV